MEYITKTQEPSRVNYPDTMHSLVYNNKGAVVSDTTSTNVRTFDGGRKTITYQRGPKKIVVDHKMVNMWKECHATTTRRWVHEPCTYNLHVVDSAASNTHSTYRYGMKSLLPLALNIDRTSFPAYPDQPSRAEVYSAVWAKLANRTNDTLLGLEDLAGLFSGRSLWSAVKGVASHTQMLAKTIRDLRRVKRAFGGKESLYQLWQSAKAELCSLLGLHLGYRFSFKTTLHDINKTCQWASQFDTYLRALHKRKMGGYLPYTASLVNVSEQQEEVNSYLVRTYCYELGSASVYNWVDTPPALIKRQAVRKFSAIAYAKVRYTYDRERLTAYIARQLGLDRPLSTLWAIIPLSFVIDYLIPVQDMANYFDNWLNDYDVSTQFSSAWALETRYKQAICEFPSFTRSGANSRYPVRLFESSGSRCVYTAERQFDRFPIPTTELRDHFPPLITSQDNKWYRNVGTGLELLSQLHKP